MPFFIHGNRFPYSLPYLDAHFFFMVSLIKHMPHAHGTNLILDAQHLMELGKQTYGRMKMWLPKDYLNKTIEMKEYFDGNIETHGKLELVTIHEQLCYAIEYQTWRNAGNRLGAHGDPSKVHSIKRTSILNRLPYWEVGTSNHKACWSLFVLLVHSTWLEEWTTFSSFHCSVGMCRGIHWLVRAESGATTSKTYLLCMPHK